MAEKGTPSWGDEIDVLACMGVVVRYRRLIGALCLATFAGACLVTLLLPDIYRATGRLIPPQGNDRSISALSAGLGNLPPAAASLMGLGKDGLYAGLLRSRTVADALVERFDLVAHYRMDDRDGAVGALARHTGIETGQADGIIVISVEDEDPKMAAALANGYMEELSSLHVKLSLDSASRQRQFLEERLARARVDLGDTENRLRAFQEKNGTIRLDDQAKALIDAYSRFKEELSAREIELGVHRTYQTEQNPEVRMLKEQIAQIRGQISNLENSAEQRGEQNLFIASSELPQVGTDYVRLLRDFKIQESLNEILTREYELAKIEEAKSTSAIQILDPASPPAHKARPQRGRLVLLCTLVAGFLAVCWAFFLEAYDRLSPERRRPWDELPVMRFLLKSRRLAYPAPATKEEA